MNYELTTVFPETVSRFHNCLQLSRLRTKKKKGLFSSHWETCRVKNKKTTFPIWKLEMKPQLLDR